MPTLRVHVISARNLVAKDGIINRTSDPYCVLRVGHCVAKTHAVKKNCNPCWDKTYDMIFHGPITGVLSVEVFDKDNFTADEPLGFFSVPLRDIDPYNTVEKWFKLNGVKHGEVRLALTCVEGFNPQPTQMVTTTTTHITSGRVPSSYTVTTTNPSAPPMLQHQQQYQQHITQQQHNMYTKSMLPPVPQTNYQPPQQTYQAPPNYQNNYAPNSYQAPPPQVNYQAPPPQVNYQAPPPSSYFQSPSEQYNANPYHQPNYQQQPYQQPAPMYPPQEQQVYKSPYRNF